MALPKNQSFSNIRLAQGRRPKIIRDRSHRSDMLPTEPGRYFWTEWDSVVQVTKRGGSCYVTPPAKTAVEVRITNNIAGRFLAIVPISP